MLNALLNTLIGRRGRILSGVTALVAALISWAVTRYGLDLPPELQAAIFTAAAGLVGWLLDGVAAYLNAKGVAIMQTELERVAPEINVDGAAGMITQRVTSQLVHRRKFRGP